MSTVSSTDSLKFLFIRNWRSPGSEVTLLCNFHNIGRQEIQHQSELLLWEMELKQDNVLLGEYCRYHKGHYQTWLQEGSEHLSEKAESQLEQKSPLKHTAGWRSEADLSCFRDDEGFTIEAWLPGSKLMEKKLSGVVSYCWGWKTHIKSTWTGSSPFPDKREKNSLYRLYLSWSL